MNTNRDKFLTEAMGWRRVNIWNKDDSTCTCDCHRRKVWKNEEGEILSFPYDFSTPEGFFKFWNWAQEQEWWDEFMCDQGCSLRAEVEAIVPDEKIRYVYSPRIELIHPDRFADAVYNFLKEVE